MNINGRNIAERFSSPATTVDGRVAVGWNDLLGVFIIVRPNQQHSFAPKTALRFVLTIYGLGDEVPLDVASLRRVLLLPYLVLKALFSFHNDSCSLGKLFTSFVSSLAKLDYAKQYRHYI